MLEIALSWIGEWTVTKSLEALSNEVNTKLNSDDIKKGVKFESE